ncbi:hypothetical protein NDU88_008821 [Pleurodeles waltl]|uniref:Uncharacterized protein n=1 Tax=Pleurodeles waltl TaxID=8319 RepID=A0AAV7NYW3_PLEWA|nr:hypothetical protein NDU88_008821 [Pleurodeles waltl]
MTAESLRCARSPYGRTGVPGSLLCAQDESTRFSSSPGAAVAPSSAGRIHHQAAADPFHQMAGRAQQRLPLLYGAAPVPCGVRVVSAIPAWGLGNLLRGAGRHPGPTSRTLLPGSHLLARRARGSEL